MSQPPIVPGPPYPQGPYPPPPAPPYPPLPPVVYYQQPPPKGDVVGKTTLATVTVVGVLILIFCVLPVVLCVSLGMVGMITDPGGGPTP